MLPVINSPKMYCTSGKKFNETNLRLLENEVYLMNFVKTSVKHRLLS